MTFERKDTQWIDPNHAEEKSPPKGNLMTDKRKDEMPRAIWVTADKNTGSLIPMYIPFEGNDGRLLQPVKYTRADISPPVPDDVAEAIENFDPLMVQYSDRHKKYLEVIIRAASTPSQPLRCSTCDRSYDSSRHMSCPECHIDYLAAQIKELKANSTPSAEVKFTLKEGCASCSLFYGDIQITSWLGTGCIPEKRELVEKLNRPHTGGK